MRRLLVLGFTVLAIGLSAGCTVPANAVAGIGIDAGGAPVGYVQVCTGHIDGATLYHDESDLLGRWKATAPIQGSARWSLAKSGPDWTQEVPLAALRSGVEYHFYGWTDDNSSSALHVSFTVSDLASIKRGEVRYATQNGEVVVQESQFRSDACKEIGPG